MIFRGGGRRRCGARMRNTYSNLQRDASAGQGGLSLTHSHSVDKPGRASSGSSKDPILLVAERRFRRLNAPELLAPLARGERCVDGEFVSSKRRVAA